ncbi:hypothetical protein [Chryseobacterium sp. JV274]|uniref:hypothetical protein n=1 Tax=unclassified Chryseobacterium TaxID=2593645 RepID=UPI0015C1E084|nr:hypothetical protein [Chryseobacterium sp. JV274]CAD0219721.1 protein of unknown function [Chryseobacterium sp. JV274]
MMGERIGEPGGPNVNKVYDGGVIEEIVLKGKKLNWLQRVGRLFNKIFDGPVHYPTASDRSYRQVTTNTLVANQGINESPQYRFILPKNFGGWSQDDTGSDGLIWKGCLSCHADNGAYTYAAHNSQEANGGKMLSAVLQSVAVNKLFGPASLASKKADEVLTLDKMIGESGTVVGTINEGWYTGDILNIEIVSIERSINAPKGNVFDKLINGVETLAKQKGFKEIRIEFKMVMNSRLASDPTWARKYGYHFDSFKDGAANFESTAVTWEKTLK